jgi:hypothetical protein
MVVMLAIFNGTFRYRALMFPAKTAFVAASALLLVGCLGRQKVEEPDTAVVGEWRAPANGTVITFSRSGLYSIFVKDQTRPVMGSFTFDPEEGTLVMQTRRESPMCADDIGQYKVHIGSLTMDVALVRDTCDARSKFMAVPFERAKTGSTMKDAREQ